MFKDTVIFKVLSSREDSSPVQRILGSVQAPVCPSQSTKSVPKPLAKMKEKSKQIFTPQVLEKQKTLDARKKLLKRKATPGELVIKGLLMILVKEKRIPKRVMFQKGLIAGNGYCIVDFYLPFIGLCIEVDGGYHFTAKQKSYDNWKNNYIINERKMRVFRINDKECLDLTPDNLLWYINNSKQSKLTYSNNYFK